MVYFAAKRPREDGCIDIVPRVFVEVVFSLKSVRNCLFCFNEFKEDLSLYTTKKPRNYFREASSAK